MSELRPVTQDWVHALPLMQQTVLLTAIRGPDGLPKYHPTKWVLRWFRRCILYSAIDRRVIENPYWKGGGSFTGPSLDWPPGLVNEQWEAQMEQRVGDYMRSLDEVSHHFQLHLMHAAEIVGYKHPSARIRDWWHAFYIRLAHDMHLFPESQEQMDARLCDNRDGWLARADKATID